MAGGVECVLNCHGWLVCLLGVCLLGVRLLGLGWWVFLGHVRVGGMLCGLQGGRELVATDVAQWHVVR